MKCSCASTNYSRYNSLNNLKFEDESESINYQPLKSKKIILVDKLKYSLGEHFMREEIEIKGIRIRQYSEGTGFFKKYLSDCLNLEKSQINSNSQSNQPLIRNDISRAQAVLRFKQKDPKNFNKAIELYYMPRDYRWSVWYINITINALLNNDSY